MGEQRRHLADLDAKIKFLSQALASTVPLRTPAPETSTFMLLLDKLSGETSQCKGSLLQCSLYYPSHDGMAEPQYMLCNLQGTEMGLGSVGARGRAKLLIGVAHRTVSPCV